MTAHILAHMPPAIAPHRTSESTRETRGRLRRNTHGSSPARARWIKIMEIVAVIVIAIALVAATLLTSRPQEREALRTSRVFVEKGDTLWSLAQAHPVSGHTTEQTARLIAELNSLDTSEVTAGHVIKLPQAGDQAPMLAQR